MRVFLYVVLWIVCGFLSARILARKGYSPILGAFIGLGMGMCLYIFAPVGLLLLLAIPPTNRAMRLADLDRKTREDLAVESQTRACRKCGRLNSIVTRVCPRCDEHLFVDAE